MDAPLPPVVGEPLAPSRRALRRRLLVVAGVLLALVAVHRSGLVDLLADEERLDRLVDDAGWLGPVVYTALFVLLIPIGVPGAVFVLPAAVIFPAPVALVICLVGGYMTSAFGVWFARTVGRDTVAARLPARFRAWDEAIRRRGLLAVIGLRIVTYLAAPADWLLGLSSIPTRQIVIGTVVGLLPPTVLYVFVGGGVLDLLLP